MFKRPSNRNFDELRNISLEANFSPYAEGSCFAKFGKTHVLCTASVESKLPIWLRNSGKGWITAEYGMLPRSTHSRMDREVTKGKPSGRTQEIQRLIGRSLRSVVDLGKLAEFQIKIDCDVIQADGKLSENPIIDQVAAISCGICENQELIDLDYEEDSSAETDGNFVMTSNNGIVEIQTTAEEKPFNKEQFQKLLNLAEIGTKNIFRIQKDALGLN